MIRCHFGNGRGELNSPPGKPCRRRRWPRFPDLQESEDKQAALISYVHIPVSDRRNRKPDAFAQRISRWILLAVIQFGCHIGRLVGVEHGSAAFLGAGVNHPDDTIRCTIR